MLHSGAALRNFKAMVTAQGGDASVLDDPEAYHASKATKTFTATHAGYLSKIDCEKVGWAVQRLGAGREKAGEPVEPHAGIEMHVKLGARIAPRQPLVTMFAADAEKLVEPENLLREALTITEEPGIIPPLVYEYVTEENVNSFS